MRLDLLRDAVAAARLPEVLAERCVHGLIEHATCRRCVDACPTGAWVIDDERLGIDPARCDGCGLCAPACPQAAIVARDPGPVRVDLPAGTGLQAVTETAALIACDRALPGRSAVHGAILNRGLEAVPTNGDQASSSGRSAVHGAILSRGLEAAPTDGDRASSSGRSAVHGAILNRGPEAAPSSAPGAGVVPCIHALGLRDLARLAAAGCRRLVVATGDCDACPRGGAVRLEVRLADLARLLDTRGLSPLRIERLAADRWTGVRDAAAPVAGPAMGRRGFLRRGLGLAVDPAADAFGLATAERAGIRTAARLLPDTGRRGALAPVGPTIDPAACTGCDACARLCPQQAIRLERPDEGALAYRILAADCTGCGICVDVCADRAVRLEPWVPAGPVRVPLWEAICERCRAPFHRPAAAATGRPAGCPVCARRGGVDRLFRVQE